MEVWQVCLTLFCGVGCFILGRQCGYDHAMQDALEIINRCADLSDDGLIVRVDDTKEDKNDDL